MEVFVYIMRKWQDELYNIHLFKLVNDCMIVNTLTENSRFSMSRNQN